MLLRGEALCYLLSKGAQDFCSDGLGPLLRRGASACRARSVCSLGFSSASRRCRSGSCCRRIARFAVVQSASPCCVSHVHAHAWECRRRVAWWAIRRCRTDDAPECRGMSFRELHPYLGGCRAYLYINLSSRDACAWGRQSSHALCGSVS